MFKLKNLTSWLKINPRAKVKLPVSFILLLCLLLFSVKFFMFSTTEELEEQKFHSQFKDDYKIYALPLPKMVDFCGEEVPLNHFDVKEKLDRELLVNTYWQSNTLLNIKRANKYFPVIEPILKKNGVPDDFKYLALIESGFTNVVSPAGAAGFWQIMKSAGKERGLEINSEVDERYHLEKATQAACDYLKEAYEKFGSWTLAAASYNMGMAGLENQLNIQKADNYYDLVLNEETSRYVYRILAVKQILNNPQNYGFNLRPQDLYSPLPTFTITVDTSISDLAQFAARIGTNYKTVKLFNPWLRKHYLTNKSGKTYEITLPGYLKETYNRIIQKQQQDSI
jgi:hypothetical protein